MSDIQRVRFAIALAASKGSSLRRCLPPNSDPSGPSYTGLVSGAALIVDYMLTIAISVASGIDAVFSLLPLGAQAFKLETELVLVVLLLYLNLRGIQESIKVLLPIFLGFFFTHVILIGYGVVSRADHLPALIPETLAETGQLT